MTKKELYRTVTDHFNTVMPDPQPELRYKNPFELLVAVILSAQCTDKRINMVTPALFAAMPTAADMASAGKETILERIRSVSYPNSKAARLEGMARMLTERYGGRVPDNRDDLMSLPGVGRKTANVVLAVAFGKQTMAVDTHVGRVSRRIGLADAKSNTPEKVERQLVENFPREVLAKAHHWLILHGRYVCTARNPKCTRCGLNTVCKHFKKQNSDS